MNLTAHEYKDWIILAETEQTCSIFMPFAYLEVEDHVTKCH